MKARSTTIFHRISKISCIEDLDPELVCLYYYVHCYGSKGVTILYVKYRGLDLSQ